MRKLDFFWRSKKEWYYWEDGKCFLSDDAPPEAQESYKHYLEQVKEIQKDEIC